MPTLTTYREEIDPATAQKYLEKNHAGNRNLMDGHAKQLAEYMTKGKFYETHQGIAFDTSGNLRDGQHRLKAITLSGTTQRMLVTRGISREAAQALDLNRRRTARDILRIGFNLTFDKRFPVALGVTVKGRTGISKPLKPTQICDAATQFGNVISTAMEWLPVRKYVGFLSSSVVVGVIARASYTVDHEDLKSFCNSYLLGEKDGKNTRAGLVLRDRLIAIQNRSGGNARTEIYGLAQNALRKFLKGEPVTKLQAIDKDIFRVPALEGGN